jgi:alpha-glucosidase
MLAGPMDYTPGGFRHVPPEDFIYHTGGGRWLRVPPYVMGTRCHQLAMMVVYESALQILCDSPYNYKNQEGLEFLKQVPTVWDETRVLEGYPGQYIIIARRKGSTWYLGGMTNNEERSFSLDLNFLKNINYSLELWSDGDFSAKHPEKSVFEERKVSNSDSISIKMATGGGFAAIIKPL